MTTAASRFAAPAATSARSPLPSTKTIAEAVRRSTRRIAPLFPLKRFVASNPFLGMTDQSFLEAARSLASAGGARLAMPRAYYAEAIRSGRISDAQLTLALELARIRAGAHDWAQQGLPRTVDVLRDRALATGPFASSIAPDLLPTVADVLAAHTDREWPSFVVERISEWSGAYFDAGQATWRSPWRDLPPFGAWHAESQLDRTAEAFGLPGFRRIVRALPAAAGDAIVHCVARLDIPATSLEPYFHRLLMTIPGWASFARHLEWESERAGERDDTLQELLAIRLAWEVILFDGCGHVGMHEWWAGARPLLDARRPDEANASDVELLTDHVLQEAFELAWQDEFVGRFAQQSVASSHVGRAPSRPSAQAVFCIDVRSEVYRRALEGAAGKIETLGFAGFFGVPLEIVRLGDEHGVARCPVLLLPSVTVTEGMAGDATVAESVAHARRTAARERGHAWRRFKGSAVSSFGFVEAAGLGYLAGLVAGSIGYKRGAAGALSPRQRLSARPRLAPSTHAGEVGGGTVGIPFPERLQLAEGMLRGMSLRDGFARVVLLVGHGASTVNNPHASSLDCGACGGHPGDVNARVAAVLLNDAEVRAGLAQRGIEIPADTVFVAALHDTTTDVVHLLDREDVPPTHRDDMARLDVQLAEASARTRRERAPTLGINDTATSADHLTSALRSRGRDWSQVRAEWGLAGCASFIAAPRHRTARLDLAGRAFLHSYDWRLDDGFRVLELIMTAPMIVASWINLQYFGSTVDNRVFGSGNKVLHNVVGTIGVVEGNGGDLRQGLPWQSVHDGLRPAHEPLRLNVVIDAPIEAISDVVGRHAHVGALVDKRWVHLWAMGEDGSIAWRYAGGGAWTRVLPTLTPRLVP